MYTKEIRNDYSKRWFARHKLKLQAEINEANKRVREKNAGNGMLTIDIEPTNKCNIRCVMCARTLLAYDHKSSIPIGLMDMPTYYRIIDEAAELGVISLRLAWYGEPLLHPNISEMIQYAKLRGIFDVGLNSNATCLTPQKSTELIESGLNRMVFSVDSPFPEQYEQIREGAHFESVIENIREFRRIRDELKTEDLIIRATMVDMTENTKNFNDYVHLLSNFVDVIGKGGFHDFSSPRTDDNKDIYSKFSCPFLWTSMVIGWDGKTYPCTIDAERNFCLGDTRRQSLSEIWVGNSYQQFRHMHTCGASMDIPLCRKCNLVDLFLEVEKNTK